MANQRADIVMSPAEVESFLESEKTTTMCTMHPDGSIHAVAMWYALVDGAITVETKAKSQKVQNLRRDPRVTFLVEAGERYEELRGVEVVGRARIIEGEDRVFDFGVRIWEKYQGPYTPDMKELVEAMVRKRVLVTVEVDRIVSWDHRKLGGLSPAG